MSWVYQVLEDGVSLTERSWEMTLKKSACVRIIYVYVCVYMCLYIVCMYTYLCTWMCVCMWMYMWMSWCVCSRLCLVLNVKISLWTLSLSLSHTHTHTPRITAHMSMRPFLWVNIFLPASAWCLSAGSSLKIRALSDLEQGLRVGREPISAILGRATLSPLSCSTWKGRHAQRPWQPRVMWLPVSPLTLGASQRAQAPRLPPDGQGQLLPEVSPHSQHRCPNPECPNTHTFHWGETGNRGPEEMLTKRPSSAGKQLWNDHASLREGGVWFIAFQEHSDSPRGQCRGLHGQGLGSRQP